MSFKATAKRKSIWIDKRLFSQIETMGSELSLDDKHYVVMCLVCLLTLHCNDNRQCYTNMEALLMTLRDEIEIGYKPKVIKGFLNALVTLDEWSIIEINQHPKKLSQNVKIDMTNLLHKKGESYFQISRYEIQQMMKSSTPQHLIVLYCNLASRWNMESYAMYEECGWDKQEDRYYDTNLQLYKYLSCYPTQEELTKTWCSRPNEKGENGFNCIERSNKWEVSRVSISNYIGELIELGVISRITRNCEGKNRSYYCRPQHSVCISEVLDILEEQSEFAKKL